jgi:hypothetical protein
MKSERLIRALIQLYPPEFRARYERELLGFHRERVRAGITMSAWLRIISDHLFSAARERLRRRRHSLPQSNRAAGPATFPQDLRYALRTLARRPVFTTAVVAIIALGAGANTAIFSVVNAILLRPLPYPNAELVVSFGHQPPLWRASPPEFLDYKNGLRSFEELAAYTAGEANLASADEPERVSLTPVTLNFFHTLGLRPMMGREFTPEEELTSPPSVVIISYALWQRRLAGAQNVIGEKIVLNGQARTVIGVMPRNFDYPTARTDVGCPCAASLRKPTNGPITSCSSWDGCAPL